MEEERDLEDEEEVDEEEEEEEEESPPDSASDPDPFPNAWDDYFVEPGYYDDSITQTTITTTTQTTEEDVKGKLVRSPWPVWGSNKGRSWWNSHCRPVVLGTWDARSQQPLEGGGEEEEMLSLPSLDTSPPPHNGASVSSQLGTWLSLAQKGQAHPASHNNLERGHSCFSPHCVMLWGHDCEALGTSLPYVALHRIDPPPFM